MIISDSQKAAIALINQELDQVNVLIQKYTGNNSLELCTLLVSKGDMSDVPSDKELVNSLDFAKLAEKYITWLGADWPKNKNIEKKIVRLRRMWNDFINEKGEEKCSLYVEPQYLNRILSIWEENLEIGESGSAGDQIPEYYAWHYALAMVLLQEVGSLGYTIGKKNATIQQAKEQFNVTEKVAENIYHSTKKMKNSYRVIDPDWNILYFLKNHAPAFHKGYKEIVRKLILENEKAVGLLNGLPD